MPCREEAHSPSQREILELARLMGCPPHEVIPRALRFVLTYLRAVRLT